MTRPRGDSTNEYVNIFVRVLAPSYPPSPLIENYRFYYAYGVATKKKLGIGLGRTSVVMVIITNKSSKKKKKNVLHNNNGNDDDDKKEFHLPPSLGSDPSEISHTPTSRLYNTFA